MVHCLPRHTGFDLDLSRPGQHKTSAAFGPTITAVPAPTAKLLTAWLGATGRTGAAAAQPHIFVPGADASKPLRAPQWTKLVKAVFKAHAGVPLAPKELRSSFITFLRSGHNSDAALSSRPPSPCGTLVGAGARGPAERRVPELCPGAQEGVMKEERSSFWGASGTLGVRLDQHWHIVAKRVRIWASRKE